MINFNEIFRQKPFLMENKDKNKWYLNNLKKLTIYHYKNCLEYKKFIDRLFNNFEKSKTIDQLPYVHTNIFKKYNLKSNSNSKISATLSSSGTTSKTKSKVFLDKTTSLYQSRALSIIFGNILKDKYKIFFVDNKNSVGSKAEFNARTAAIKGFYQFIKDPEYILDENNNLNLRPLQNFLDQNPNEIFIIFGFTSIIWNFLIQRLSKKEY